jgi:hypothetical protein
LTSVANTIFNAKIRHFWTSLSADFSAKQAWPWFGAGQKCMICGPRGRNDGVTNLDRLNAAKLVVHAAGHVSYDVTTDD